jgi:hypothetical protein
MHGSSLTIVLTNWKRSENLRLIIDQLLSQTLKPELFLWNNGDTFESPPIAWQVDSSRNVLCWPRWFMASMASTEFVAVMDDDLIFSDATVLEDAITFMRSLAPETIVGMCGLLLDPAKPYRDGEHRTSLPGEDQVVDIVKGRFMLLRTDQLKKLRLAPDPSRDMLMGEDIHVSGALAEGRRGMHILPSLFAGRWKELPAPHGLVDMPDHWEYREKARQAVFRDQRPGFFH